jgi:ketosteroid isomerase-like protein
MSQQNVELVARVVDQAQHDPAVLWRLLDDDVIWELGDIEIPDAGATRWRGPAGVQDFFRRWTGSFDEWGYEVRDVIDAGDSVVTHIHQWGRGKVSGAMVESEFWQVWTLRDRKVVRATHHSERAAALESVGVRE